MSDLRDQSPVDDLEARLRVVLHHDVAEVDDPPISVGSIRAASARRDRQARTRTGAAVLAAAAILLAVVVVRLGASDQAYVDLGPSTPKPALHLLLDEAAGLETQSIQELGPDPAGRPPGTDPGPAGRTDVESIAYGGDDLLSPPWVVLTISTTDRPTGSWGDPAANQRATTVGGRPAVLTADTVGSEDWNTVSLKWDERRSASAKFWGLAPDEVAAALATLQQDTAGRWSLADPPLDLRELARIDDDEAVDGWYESRSRYWGEDSADPLGIWPYLGISRVDGDMDEAALLGRLLSRTWGREWAIERATVRGQPALLLIPTGAADPTFRPNSYTFMWFEPEHDVVVTIAAGSRDRALLDQLAANLVEVEPEEWRTKLASCTGIEQGGTTMALAAWVSGGPCPGFEERGG